MFTFLLKTNLKAMLLLLVFSCATVPKTRFREGDNTGQEIDITVSQEREMTKEYLPKMEKDFPPVKNNFLQSYITRVGNKIVAANNLDKNPYEYTFKVVQSDSVNAFALPAGVVFVTMPLLNMTETEAELSGVIGHEIGHIVARHTAERIYKQKKSQKKNLIWTAGASVIGAAAGFGVGKLVCKKEDTECLLKATGGGAAVGAGGSLLVQKYQFMAHSKEDEMEADRIGFKYAYRAGYSKEKIGLFYDKLLQMEQKYSKNQNKFMQSLSDAMSTHPPSKNRVDQMKSMSKKATPLKNPVVNTPSFFKAKKIVNSFMKK